MKRRSVGSSRSEFFLSEVLAQCPDLDGHIIELMRSASHIRDFQRLFAALGTTDSDDSDEIVADLEKDSLRILALNFAASQLREALKLFSRAAAVPSFVGLASLMPASAQARIERLSECTREFDAKTGLLYSIIRPLRDKTFHYDPTAARVWARERMASEKEPKPPVSSVDLRRFIFGPGMEFDESLYSSHLFWGGGAQVGLLKVQAEVWQLQEIFLQVVADVTAALMKKSGVPRERSFDWFCLYRYGFKKVSAR